PRPLSAPPPHSRHRPALSSSLSTPAGTDARIMHLPPPLLLLLSFALGASAASSSSASAAASTSAGSSSSAIGTPTNSAALPSLSGVSPCVANCLELATAAANCSSEVAVNCFCVAPNAKPYAKALVSCLTACPTEVASTEALVEQFCAAATKPTSLSFPSFVLSSTSASASASASASSVSGSTFSTVASTTAPASSSPPPSTTSSAARPLGVRLGLGHGMCGVAMTVAGILLGAALLR
ncbi:hypothetical protein FB451DRAFT_760454, partial [Mycena latifolia]